MMSESMSSSKKLTFLLLGATGREVGDRGVVVFGNRSVALVATDRGVVRGATELRVSGRTFSKFVTTALVISPNS
jgi:hypothetical protein